MSEPMAMHDRRDVVGTLATGADFEVRPAGVHVRLVPISDRALQWFWGSSLPDDWPYFHMRRYGDTPFGWYLGQFDEGFASLVDRLQAAGFSVEGVSGA